MRLGDVTLEENNSTTYIAILNQGSVEIYGNAFIADGQRIFLGTYLSETVKIVDGKKETVTERKFHEITISKENWLNKKADSEEVNHVEIDFVTKNAVMNKPVVQFASVMENGEENKSKLYNAYKQYLQDGNEEIFTLTQSASFVLRCDDEKFALVLALHSYDILFMDLSKDSDGKVIASKTIKCGDPLSDETLASINSIKPTNLRYGYTFVGWAYYNEYPVASEIYSDFEGLGVRYSFKDDEKSVDVYSQILSGEGKFSYVENLQNVRGEAGNEFKFPAHNFYLYAVWKPNEYDVEFVYEPLGHINTTINNQEFSSSLGMMNVLKKKVGYGLSFNLPLASEVNKTLFVTYDDVTTVERDAAGVPQRVALSSGESVTNFELETSGLYAGSYFYTKQVAFGESVFELKFYVGENEDRAWSVFMNDTDLSNPKVTLRNSLNIDGEAQKVDPNVYPEKVTFEKDGNNVSYETSVDEDGRYFFVDAESGRKYVSRQLIRLDGYEFSNYKINGNLGYGAGDLFRMDESNPDFSDLGRKITVTVMFKRLTVKLILNNNDSQEGSVTAEKDVYPGTEILLPTMYDFGEFENIGRRENYSLVGFSKNKNYATDGQGVLYAPGDRYVVTESSTGVHELYAIWEEAECFVQPTNSTKETEKWFYSSLSKAFEDVSSNVYGTTYSQFNIVILKQNVEVKSELVVLADVILSAKAGEVTLKLSDDFAEGKAMFVVGGTSVSGDYTKAKLTIDGKSGTNLVISQGTVKNRSESLIVVNPNSVLNILGYTRFENATVTNENRGGMITVFGQMGEEGALYGVVNISGTGVVFSGNSSINGGAIYVGSYGILNAEADDKDGISFGKTKDEYKENTASGNGGAIFAQENAQVTLKNVWFKDNTASVGGAIYISADCKSNISDCTFSGNTATGSSLGGGAIYSQADLKLSATTFMEFDSNNSLGNGGAVFASGVLTLVGNPTFTKNTAKTSGGAIFAPQGLVLDGGYFESNVASEGFGGAVYVKNILQKTTNNETLTVTFKSNKATYAGAIAIIDLQQNTSLDNLYFDSNEYVNEGGAIYVQNAAPNFMLTLGKTVNISGSKALGGNAQYQRGGAVYMNNGNLLFEGTADGNAAVSGGAFYLEGLSRLILNGARVQNSSAERDGGAIYVGGSSYTQFTGDNTVLSSNSAVRGGAMFVNSSNTNTVITNVTFDANTLSETSMFGEVLYISGNSQVTMQGNIGLVVASTDSHQVYVGKNGTLTLINAKFVNSENVEISSKTTVESEIRGTSVSHGKIVMDEKSYITDIYFSPISKDKLSANIQMLTVSGNMSSTMENRERIVIHLYDVATDAEIAGLHMVKFDSSVLATFAEEYFELDEETKKFVLAGSGSYLDIIKMAEDITIDPNGGEITYNGTTYTEPFKIQLDDSDDNTLKFLDNLTGFRAGYKLQNYFDGYVDGEATGSRRMDAQTIKPYKQVTLKAVWEQRSYAYKSYYQNEKSEYIEVGGGNIMFTDRIYLTAPARQYLTCVGWKVFYVDATTSNFIPLIDKVMGLKDSFSLNRMGETVEETKSKLKLVEENGGTVCFVAQYEKTMVEITFDGNGGTSKSGEPSVKMSLPQSREYLTYASLLDTFSKADYAVNGIFTGVDNIYHENVDTMYDFSNPSICIKDLTKLTLHCNWQKVEAVIIKNNVSAGEINRINYETVGEAIKNLLDGDTLEIVSSKIELKSALVFNKAISITVTASKPVTLTRATSLSSYMIRVENGQVTFDSNNSTITLDGNNDGSTDGAIYVASGATLVAGDVLVVANQNVTNNGAAIVNYGRLVLVGAKISNCSTKGNGGAIWNNGSLLVTDATIENCSATNGGAIWTNGTAEIAGGTFDKNCATMGASIYVGNKVDGVGEGIVIHSATFENGNMATYASKTLDEVKTYGGAIYVAEGVQRVVVGVSTQIIGNKATYGGGLYYVGDKVAPAVSNISFEAGCVLSENSAVYGGAIFFWASGR